MKARRLDNHDPVMDIALGPLKLKNPIITASGTCGYGLLFEPYFDTAQIGGLTVKGLTLKPRSGHPQRRLAETSSGLLNCIGLENIGVDRFIREKLPILRSSGTAIIVNINGSSVEEYVRLAERLSGETGVDALEINVSCPNVKAGGIHFGADPEMIYRVTDHVRSVTSLPLFVKLSPNVSDIKACGEAAERGGADGVSLINTLLGMAVNAVERRPVLSNITGGLSGPAIKPVALRCVWEVAQTVSIPIIGGGGIMTGIDAAEFIIAGATAVSVGTAIFVHPDAPIRILKELQQFMRKSGISRVSDLVGTLQTGF